VSKRFAVELCAAERRQSSERLTLINGDFVATAEQVAVADVVTLDKVVCCYPDMERLLLASTGHTSRLLGIVYPRDSWWVRLVAATENALNALRRRAFRVYIFPNAAIDNSIRRAGLTRRFQRRGFAWVVALHERSSIVQ
jgi:magnesium-protoporphyrin O-methyltransferase